MVHRRAYWEGNDGKTMDWGFGSDIFFRVSTEVVFFDLLNP